VEKMLLDLSEIYSKQTLDEIERMVESPDADANVSKNFIDQMLDQSNPQIIKSKGKQESLRQQLTWKHQVFIQYRRIDPDVLRHVTWACQGNPLMILSYFQSLISRGYLDVVKDAIAMSPKLRGCLSNGTFMNSYDLPYQLSNMQSVFFNNKFINLNSQPPLVIVACLYTLRVSTLIGR